MYDAVIIGAGIGGLVCGNYLAKTGLKVLIAEQHHQPGGYCTSFTRKGILFDAAAHSFGGYRESGMVRKVFRDCFLEGKVRVTRYDPSDVVVSPHHRISFHADIERTIEDVAYAFPKEGDNFRSFAQFLRSPDQRSFVRMRRHTFKDLLDHYFQDDRLKAMIAFPIFGNSALPPSKISAFVGAMIFNEFLLDGGYYPDGGMQALSNALAQNFREFGGDLLLSTPVDKIFIDNGCAAGIIIGDGRQISARTVISNSDARQTFLRLIGKKYLPADFVTKLNQMNPSLSMFVLYLGLAEQFKHSYRAGSNIWHLPHDDLERMYRSSTRRTPSSIEEFMVRISPDSKSILGFFHSAFRTNAFWVEQKSAFIDAFAKRIACLMPDLPNNIVYRDAATPSTMYRYTTNYRGAAYGWECTPEQLADPDFRRPSFIRNLYLTGHWSTQGIGIPGVAYSGYDTATSLLKKEKKRSLAHSHPSPE